MDNDDKSWMYRRLKNGFITQEYINGVEAFMAFAISHNECLSAGKVRCPCNRKKCQNKIFLDEDTVKVHLGRYGFVDNYYNWHHHGEEYVRPSFPNINLDAPSSSSSRFRNIAMKTQFTNVDPNIQNYMQENLNSEENLQYEMHNFYDDGQSQSIDPNDSPESPNNYIKGLYDLKSVKKETEQMETYFGETMTPFEDVIMPDVSLPQEINRQFIVPGCPKKRKLYGLSTIASTIYHEAMAPRPRGFVDAGQSLYALREEARESREEARAATQRAKEAEKRAVEARQECKELRFRVSSLEESVRVLLSGMSRGSHSGYSSHRRGSSQVGRGSPHTGKSSQGSREVSRGSPVGRGSQLEKGTMAGRSSHISKSFQGRASSNHMDSHLTRGDGDDDEYDDNETQP